MGKQLFFRDISLATPIKDCISFNMLSVRSFEICNDLGLRTVGDLLMFHYKHFTFVNKRSFEQELHSFCEQLGHLNQELMDLISQQPPFAPLLDEVQMDSFARQMKLKSQDMPIALRSLFKTLDISKYYREYIMGEKSDLHLLGKQSLYLNQVSKLRMELRQYAFELLDMPASFEFDKLVETCEVNYGCKPGELEMFRPLADSGSFPLFGFIAYLIDNGHLLNEEAKYLLGHRLGWLTGMFVLPELLAELEKSVLVAKFNKMERNLPSIILEYLMPLKVHKAYLERQTNYGFDIKAPVVYFTQEAANRINHAEEANLHPCFCTAIAWAIFQPERLLICYRSQYTWNNYMVRKDIAEAFNFEAFLTNHGKQLNEYKSQGEWPNMMDSLRQYFKLLPMVYQPVVEEILATIAKDNPVPLPSSIRLGYMLGEMEKENKGFALSRASAL